MRVHARRMFWTVIWIWGIIIFIQIVRFYSNYKYEFSSNSQSIKDVNLTKLYIENVSNKAQFKVVDIERKEDIFNSISFKIDKSKQRPNSNLRQHNNVCNITIFSTNSKIIENSWQQVDVDKRIFVFSAYYIKSIIHVIGARIRKRMRVICQLWISNENGYLVVTNEVVATEDYELRDGSRQKYTSTVFKCKNNKNEIPTHVSLVTHPCDNPFNLLQVNDVSNTGRYQHQFTVCLSPLNFRYGRAYELVEWIELNKILGADKFFVYNYSSADNVAQILDYYTNRNTTDVIQWRLPMGVDTFPKTNEQIEISYFGQAAALNDCLYRCKKSSKFVVNLDLDEFIIPHSAQRNSWYDIIKQVETAPVYMFKNAFFRKEWDKLKINFTGKEIAEKLRLVTLQVYLRETKILPPGFRSKYIARTSDIDLMLTHEVPRARMLAVPVDTGLLHHYRNWENPNDNAQRVKDTTLLEKYKTPLIQNVQSVWKFLSHVKMDIPII